MPGRSLHAACPTCSRFAARRLPGSFWLPPNWQQITRMLAQLARINANARPIGRNKCECYPRVINVAWLKPARPVLLGELSKPRL